MRRHPLGSRPYRLLAGSLVAVFLVTAVAQRLAATATTPGAAEVTITSAPGEKLAFEPVELTMQTADPLTITFRNGSSLAHNLVFTAGVTAATRTIVAPGTSDRILVVPTGPGAYPFVCTIHEEMAGRLIILGSDATQVESQH